MSQSERLAQYIFETTYDSLPQDVRDMAVSCVFNYMAAPMPVTPSPRPRP